LKHAVLILAALAAPAQAQSAAAGQTCVQVTLNNQPGPPYNCLNQQLQQLAESARPQPTLPLSATSPSNATGTFNETGVAEQYGKNFGHSVIPYRPPIPVFTNNLH
jgi:hypothetical protein